MQKVEGLYSLPFRNLFSGAFKPLIIGGESLKAPKQGPGFHHVTQFLYAPGLRG
jgi:hypothetical protein